MLKVKQLGSNMLEYNLKKEGEFILFGEGEDIFKKYYNYQI